RFSVSTASMAQATLANIDKFIEYVDSNRAELGAIQNHSSACNLVPKSCDFMSFCSFFLHIMLYL
ncbi:hypothetical protein ACTNC5_12185, partial [Anaerobiospirillum succiniciproducens]